MLNRRELIKGGAAAGVVLMFGRVSLAQADQAEEPYLRRAFWAGREGQSFGALTLLSVTDVNERLAGRDDAFRLLFAGPRDGAQAVAGLGLFVAPVGADGDRHEVIVDRSIPLPRNAPTPPAPPTTEAPPVARTAAVAPKKGVTRLKPAKHKTLSRKARRRRARMLRQLARRF